MNREELASLWSTLEKTPVPSGGVVTRRIPHPVADVFAGVELSTSKWFFAVGGKTGHEDFTVSRAFSVKEGLANNQACLLLQLDDPEAKTLFSHVVEDLLEEVSLSESGKEAVGILERILWWQDMLKSIPTSGLSDEKQRGLYGELHLLRHTLLPHGGLKAVAGWAGPDSAHQDFRMPRVAVEVKTSVGLQPQGIQISSERQLDETGCGTLYLYHLSLDARQAGTGETLPQMVAFTRTLLHGPSLRTFNSLLVQVGYLDEDAERYQHTFYALRQETLMHVRPGFPRILESDLSPGVGRVSYEVQWSECSPFAVNMSELHSLLAQGTPSDTE